MRTAKGKKAKRASGQGDTWPTMMSSMNKMEKIAPMPDFEQDREPSQLRKARTGKATVPKSKSISPKIPKLK